MDSSNKNVLITGASRGIGRAVARAFARGRGWRSPTVETVRPPGNPGGAPGAGTEHCRLVSPTPSRSKL